MPDQSKVEIRPSKYTLAILCGWSASRGRALFRYQTSAPVTKSPKTLPYLSLIRISLSPHKRKFKGPNQFCYLFSVRVDRCGNMSMDPSASRHTSISSRGASFFNGTRLQELLQKGAGSGQPSLDRPMVLRDILPLPGLREIRATARSLMTNLQVL